MRNLIRMVGVGAVWSSIAWAGTGVEPCREISWMPDNVYAVRSQLHVATHIILPEPMQGKPVAGNATLWAVNGENVHLFIKPKTKDADEGTQTSVSVVSGDNTSFDFFVKRVMSDPDICIKIVKDDMSDFGEGHRQGWKTAQQQDAEQLATQLSAAQQAATNYRQEITTVKQSSQKQLLKTLADYRMHIYTGYTWDDGGASFFGGNFISDVYDDGRFTYIRVTHDNKAILQISATIDGQEEMIEYAYDEDRKMYTISGIFPAFVLRYDESDIDVKRRDGATRGAS
jgi:type IV secretory pathway VirB9-like protein